MIMDITDNKDSPQENQIMMLDLENTTLYTILENLPLKELRERGG